MTTPSLPSSQSSPTFIPSLPSLIIYSQAAFLYVPFQSHSFSPTLIYQSLIGFYVAFPLRVLLTARYPLDHVLSTSVRVLVYGYRDKANLWRILTTGLSFGVRQTSYTPSGEGAGMGRIGKG